MRLIFLFIFVVPNLSFATDEGTQKNAAHEQDDASKFAVQMYRLLFHTKRQEQKSAIKQIRSYADTKKRDSLITALINAMKKTFVEARVEIERSGFIPGMSFPDESKTDLKEVLSKILENAAFFSDLALYFPDIVTTEYKSNRELQTLVNWALIFANTTRFYDEKTTELMHLAGQELGLVDRDPDFVNPYSSARQLTDAEVDEINRRMEEEKRLNKEEAKRLKKEEKRKERKGPKLQGGRREL